jgi:hypothetical protein
MTQLTSHLKSASAPAQSQVNKIFVILGLLFGMNEIVFSNDWTLTLFFLYISRTSTKDHH